MDELILLGQQLWENGEPGFFEIKTHSILAEKFNNLGFSVKEQNGIPGFSAVSEGIYEDKPVVLIADMDALPLPGNIDGKYIHSCGHHVQMTALFGTAALLQKQNPELLKKIAFLAIPAEEYIDLEQRDILIGKKLISFKSGKLEYISRGIFTTPKYIIATHSAPYTDSVFISSVLHMAGFQVMTFSFSGKASHAGAAPHLGINAQNAASLFLQACAFLRESFDESKHIRIHPILKLDRNQSVNLIPEHVTVETYVRAEDIESVYRVVEQLRNAAEGCAGAIGGDVAIEIQDGYKPFKADPTLHKLIKDTAENMNIRFIEEKYSSA
ncbi:MAG: M20/M25/M40 family metallo-hydrolase, partial [Spirochaetales bacterium]|nr:M20/M25/M40 family metallo-hydrolase [Spirochaetales bacterium]